MHTKGHRVSLQKKLLTLAAFLAGNALFTWLGCASLPEPDSADARLYVRYCSGSGCHDPILPQAGGRKYWDQQIERMLDLMRKANKPLPNADETRRIARYLHSHAQGSNSY